MTSYEREQKKMHEQMEKNMLPIFLGVIGAILAGPALFFVASLNIESAILCRGRSERVTAP